MASIHVEATVDVTPDELWSRVADAGRVSELLDVVAESSLDGDMRSCTLADGRQLTERIITVDHGKRRVAYTILDGMPVEYHAASMQVLDAGDGRATLRWITDIAPDEAAERLEPLFQAEDGRARGSTLTIDSVSPSATAAPLRTLALAALALAAVGAAVACSDEEAADACLADGAALEVPHVIPTEPATGAVVGETFTVRGCSRTFESNIQWRLSEPAGAELARGFAMGGGVDGSAPFEFTVTAPVTGPTLVQLRVFEADVSDGRGDPPPQAVIPLLLSP